MIDSVEKKQALRDIITHWCNYTKIMPYLRDGDISFLASSIISEFYHITLSCGHLVKELNESIVLEYDDTTDRVGVGVIRGSFCNDCAEEYIKEFGAKRINAF